MSYERLLAAGVARKSQSTLPMHTSSEGSGSFSQTCASRLIIASSTTSSRVGGTHGGSGGGAPNGALDEIDYFHGMRGQYAVALMRSHAEMLDAEMISLRGPAVRCVRWLQSLYRQRLYTRLYIQRGLALARGDGSRVLAALDDGPLLKSLALERPGLCPPGPHTRVVGP